MLSLGTIFDVGFKVILAFDFFHFRINVCLILMLNGYHFEFDCVFVHGNLIRFFCVCNVLVRTLFVTLARNAGRLVSFLILW